MRALTIFALICTIGYISADPLLDALICKMCTDIVTEAENAGLEYSETWLTNKFNEYCDELGFFKTACNTAVKNVLGDLDTYIRQALAPNVCCEKVSLCKEGASK
uniref:Saposin B-type domain-containing protein n=1 Tax=Syphacia muris TaxID=451379 RepID=A0A0N5ATV4_9BILA